LPGSLGGTTDGFGAAGGGALGSFTGCGIGALFDIDDMFTLSGPRAGPTKRDKKVFNGNDAIAAAKVIA
jgi:hypothetical protein